MFALLNGGKTAMSQDADSNPAKTISPLDYKKLVQSTDYQSRKVHASDFRKMMAQAGTVILDLRPDFMYKASHISGAKNLGPDIREDRVAAFVPSINTQVLIYCENSLSPFSRMASQTIVALPQLLAFGYENVYWLDEDYDSKNRESLPMESGQ
jgi:rhodanese-related sulfurtransferase